MSKIIDLNCDMGESFGAWRMGNDAELMNYVSSINVACGFHAGDAQTMRETVQLAIKKGVAIGAHPSFPDLQGFGRRHMSLSPQEIFDVVLYQVSALKGICEAFGTKLHHVKPHGALYNLAAKDEAVAGAVAEAVRKIDSKLILFGLAGSSSISEAEKVGLKTASEVFADRTYQPDGSLTPRTQADALIDSTEKSISQVLQMISDKTVTATNGEQIPIAAETICIHGDGTHAVKFAKIINQRLTENGIKILPI
ncbi:MAG: LamB/YcsF family protein [Pyrinomonadaceae bacterium]|nr:LamB/YcsF family protein [Pyrinomonadaceae bacterium]